MFVGFVFWFCIGRHLAFALTYSPTCGNSQSKTIRFDDRLSLERARHELKKKLGAPDLYLRILFLSNLFLGPHQCHPVSESVETKSRAQRNLQEKVLPEAPCSENKFFLQRC